MFVVSPSANDTKSKTTKTISSGDKTATTAAAEQDDDDADSVSDSDGMIEEDELTEVPSVVSIPFLSPERKKHLQDCIVEARKEWR